MSILEEIRKRMVQGPTYILPSEEENEPRKKKEKKKWSPEIDEKMFGAAISNKIATLFKDRTKEIEASFGCYFNDAFIPGILSKSLFYSTIEKMKKLSIFEVQYEESRVEKLKGSNIRKIIEEKKTTFQRKVRHVDDTIDLKDWGIRISSSSEDIVKPIPWKKEDIEFVRLRKRTTFEGKKGTKAEGFKIDFTNVTEEGNYQQSKLEVEIERTSITSPEKFKDLIEMIYKIIYSCSLALREDVVQDFNYLFREEMNQKGLMMNNPLKMFTNFWAKPVNLKVEDILKPSFTPFVTIKMDGTRNFLFCSSSKAFLCMPPFDVSLVGSTSPAFDGTLIDGELVEVGDTKIFYAFDVLFKSGKDHRFSPLEFRLVLLSEILPSIKLDGIHLLAKEFFANNGMGSKQNYSFYETFKHTLSYKIKNNVFEEALEVPTVGKEAEIKKIDVELKDLSLKLSKEKEKKKVDDLKKKRTQLQNKKKGLLIERKVIRVPTDGYIFQGAGSYTDESRKWKPESLMTIDFLLTDNPAKYGIKKFKAGKVYLLALDGKSYSIFEGIPGFPYSGTTVLSGDEKKMLLGNVVEMKYHAQSSTFVPYKLRLDRGDKPNAVEVAKSVWRDIMTPLSMDTLLGKDLVVMRRFHNMMKGDLIDRNLSEGDTILDIGSGRGGDLFKWKKKGLSKVYAIEPNKENLKEFKERLDDVKGLDVTIINKGAEETTEIAKVVKTKVDAVIAFFSLTYFAEDKEKFDGLLATINDVLAPGGKLIGAVLDGNSVKTELLKIRNEKKIPDNDPSEINTPSFSIEQSSEFDDSAFGNEITTNIKDPTSMVKDQKEWLFDVEYFRKKLEMKNIVKVNISKMDQGKLFDRLNEDGKLFSRLNTVFVFEKKEGDKTNKNVASNREISFPVFGKKMLLPKHKGQKFEMGYEGVDPGPNQIFSAVLFATDPEFRGTSEDKEEAALMAKEREQQTILLRKRCANEISMPVFEMIQGGRVMGGLAMVYQNEKGSRLKAMADFRKLLAEKLSDGSWEHFDKSALLLLERTLKIRIFTMNSSGFIIDSDHTRENFKQCIILMSPNGISYFPVWKEVDKEYIYIFDIKDEIVRYMPSGVAVFGPTFIKTVD